jgi:hypothetical protein
MSSCQYALIFDNNSDDGVYMPRMSEVYRLLFEWLDFLK